MKTITISNVNIDIHDGPVGVGVSGGADSAIMLYIVMTYCEGPIHVYTCVSKQKNRVAPHVAINVIGKCIDLLGRTDVTHHSTFVDKQEWHNMFGEAVNDANTGKINYMYSGLTASPPNAVLEGFNEKLNMPVSRDPSIVREVYRPPNGKFYAPFYNVDKQKICEVYKELGVLEDLFPVTRSCESFVLTEGHCGKCWWCEERQWGFGRLI